jgi:enamine deaminase RidA (YjgF/YER057c/UK114 family)
VREAVRDGGGFQEAAAYSRAVRVGHHVAVSATAPLDGDTVVFAGDLYRQTRAAIAKALGAAPSSARSRPT